ncbi:MAG: hypothetical protein JKY86_15480 [Gammaproteobacteria bacterium]|nr:hypothetical protein [Gammaproteobacteria bacterium]
MSHITNNNSFSHLSCDDGTARGFRGKYLSLIDDKPTEYPWLEEGEIKDWLMGVGPMYPILLPHEAFDGAITFDKMARGIERIEYEILNEEIDKLGRGLSDD